MTPSAQVVAAAKLNSRFQLGERDPEQLIRDLIDYVLALEARHAEYDLIIDDINSRLTAGGL